MNDARIEFREGVALPASIGPFYPRFLDPTETDTALVKFDRFLGILQVADTAFRDG